MAAERVDYQVIVVGAGPVGLLLAGELALAGVSVALVERLTTPMSESRASQLNTRTAELLSERGLYPLVAEARREPRGHFGGQSFELSGVDSPLAGNWKVPQYRTEAVLAERAAGAGVTLLRGYELIGLEMAAEHVGCVVDGPHERRTLRSSFVVGCDGHRSVVRRLAGFDLSVTEGTQELLRADVTGIEIPDRRFERHERGLAIAATGAGVTRVMVHEFGRHAPARDRRPDFAEIAEVWARVTGEDISGGTVTWVDAFDNTRGQARRYRHGRVLLAGDAAHWHLPVGGQAINIGLQDAVNLGWKLAGTVHGWAPPELLDTYHTERHPIGEHILTLVTAQELLLLGGQDTEAVREVMSELLAFAEVRDHLAGVLSGLDIRYGVGGHPLAGRRMPIAELRTASGESIRTSELLAGGHGYLLCPAASPSARTHQIIGASDRQPPLRVVPIQGGGHGVLDDATMILVRPDGYIAWAGADRSDVAAAVASWFGPGSFTRSENWLMEDALVRAPGIDTEGA